MDNKQAIKNIKDLKKWKYLGDRKYMLALDKAIASLEAWDKVIEDLDEKIDEQYVDKYDFCYQQGIEFALELIKKYKKEIEE